MKPPMKLRSAIISRLKIMELDISERRLPQDGRIKLKLGKGKEMDFRVSVCPTLFGEKVVMRLLDKSNLQLDMTKLGFEERSSRTSSRRSTVRTAWCSSPARPARARPRRSTRRLSKLNEVAWNISTAEDPVEFNFFGINQVQMHEDIGSTSPPPSAASCARTPTSSWSARSATSRPPRSREGRAHRPPRARRSTRTTRRARSRASTWASSRFVTASLNAIVAQRLCRGSARSARSRRRWRTRRCSTPASRAEEIGTFQPFEPGGCKSCNDRGYKGRVAVYEVMPLWDGLKELVIQGCSAAELKQEAIRLGSTPA